MSLLQATCLLLLGLIPQPTLAQAFTLCGNATILTITSTDDATALASALQCSNGEFYVQWVGEVVVEETIHVTNGTSLNITGTAGAVADGDFKTGLFAVDGGSFLHLRDMALVQGFASDGGAIHSDESSVSFSGISIFRHNTAFEEDPSYYSSSTTSSEESYYYSSTSSSSTSPAYPRNSERGGAIHAVSSTLSWEGGDVSFVENKAGYDGGAIWAWDSSVSFNGGKTCEFVKNTGHYSVYGGAIFASGSRISWDGVDNTTFYGNTAYFGGAIYLHASNVTWGGAGETQFIHNFASADGGAIWAGSRDSDSGNYDDTTSSWSYYDDSSSRRSSWTLDDDWTSSWTNYDDFTTWTPSSASSWTYDDDFTSWTSSSTSSWVYDDDWTHDDDLTTWTTSSTSSWSFDDDYYSSSWEPTSSSTYFSPGEPGSSIAWDSGMVFDNNEARADGGGIFLDGSELEVLAGGSAVFAQNKAGRGGGGVFCVGAEFTVAGQVSFTNNTADSGAGIGLIGDSSLDLTGGNVTISENVASSKGGGIHAEASTRFVIEGTTFLANSAGTTGGAISLLSVGMAPTADTKTSDAAIVSDCRFIGNDAGDAGGAVAAAGGLAEISYSEFEGNVAGRSHMFRTKLTIGPCHSWQLRNGHDHAHPPLGCIALSRTNQLSCVQTRCTRNNNRACRGRNAYVGLGNCGGLRVLRQPGTPGTSCLEYG